MKDFKIDDIIRYLIAGFWISFLLNQVNFLPKIIDFNNEPLLISISFAIGLVVYSGFRTFLFPYIQIVIDFTFSKNKSGRNYIKHNFKNENLNWATRNDLWVLFHQMYPNKFPGLYSIWLSSILTMYTLSISTVAIIILRLSLINHSHLIMYICFSLGTFIVGVISHVNFNSRYLVNALMATEPNLIEFVELYLKNRQQCRK